MDMQGNIGDGCAFTSTERFCQIYQPGEVIFIEGSPGDTMCIVQVGSVEIHKETDQGRITLATLARGEIFGEMALVDRSPRSATAIAGGDGAHVLTVDRPLFIYLVSQQPAFALMILGIMANRLRAKNEVRHGGKG